MNRLAALYKLYIFEMIPKEQRVPGKAGWWRNLQQGKQVPSAFARGFLLTGDVIMLSFAVWIGITTHAPGITIAGLEILFVGACALLLVSRRFKRFLSVVGAYLAVVGLGIILNLVFPGMWGVVVLYALCVNVFYRFPPAWSLPLAVVCILADRDGWGTATSTRSASRESRDAGIHPGARLHLVLVWVDTAQPVSARGEITRGAGAIEGADGAQRRTGGRTGAHTDRSRYSRCPFALTGRPFDPGPGGTAPGNTGSRATRGEAG